MARIETAYDRIEAGIVAKLTADGSPFVTVAAYGAHLADSEILDELERLQRISPAALVIYGGGRANGGYAGVLEEEAAFTVLVIAAGTSRETAIEGDDARPGVYALIDYVRSALHNRTDVAGANNPLLHTGTRRFALPGGLLTVAAYAVDFITTLQWDEGE